MTDRPVSAFMLSATLHGMVVGILLMLSYAANQRVKDLPRVLELVAGDGDNYGARVAPKLGTSDAVKIDVPVPPVPKAQPILAEPPAPIVAEPPAPIVAEPPAPPPVKKAPAPVPTKTAEPSTVPNFEKQIRRKVIVAESKAKLEIARQRRAEEKRIADEKRKIARMTKAEFDRLNKSRAAATRTAPAKTAPTKVAKIDAEGIAKGVVGGSAENKVGGARGKALVSDNADVLAAYDAMFKQRLARAFDAPPGMSDTLVVTIQLRSNADGSLTGAKIGRSSGNPEFDHAVLAAVGRVQMPARPDGRSEVISFDFSMRDRDR